MIKETVLSRSIRSMFLERVVKPMTVSAALAISLLVSVESFAQVAAAAQKPADDPESLQTLVVTGTRFSSRVVSDSQTPIDLISGKELANVGQGQLQTALKALVPSFSVSAPATAGALDFTSSPTLRGLGPGDLLLMVNGKRRHSTGALNLNNQIGRGDVGYDFNTLPAAAIGRVEVLRDGASAQYGADAVAGVLNVVLDKSLGGIASIMTGITSEGDGRTRELNAALGIPFGVDGVVRTTVRFQDRERSNRAEPDTRQQYFGSNGTRAISGNYGSGIGLTPANGTLDPREATFNRNSFQLGDAPYKSGAAFVNAEKPFGNGGSLYAFGGYSRLSGDSPGFYRRPGDNNTVRALFPNGFLPQQRSVFENFSVALGAKGDNFAGFAWDLSSQFGQSKIDNDIFNSNNPSMGAASPTAAYLGGTRFGQWTNNLDLTRELQIGSASPTKFALGAEFRKEYFEAVAGELASYRNGGVAILDGPGAGGLASVGIQPLAGLTPQDALNAQRNSFALYSELEQDLAKNWVVTGAARFERFSDFGSSSTFKLSSRYKIADPLALRGSVSTGFRAPNLAQSYTSTTTVTFLSGNPVNLRLLPVADPIARLLGATDLRPAKSKNASLGLVFTQDAFAITTDIYQIDIRDRLALSSTFQDVRVTNLLASQGFPGIGAISYMTNAIDTTTKGVDLTSSYRHRIPDQGTLTVTAAANYNKTTIKRIAPTPVPLSNLGITTPLYDLTQQVRLTDASPRDKYVLGLNWKKSSFTVNLNIVRYGEVSAVAFTSLTPAQIAVATPGYNVRLAPTPTPSANSQVIQTFGAKILTDLSTNYQIGNFSVTVGVNNVFNTYPDKQIASTPATVAAGTNGSDNAGIFPYHYISPFGFIGRTMFAKLDYKF